MSAGRALVVREPRRRRHLAAVGLLADRTAGSHVEAGLALATHDPAFAVAGGSVSNPARYGLPPSADGSNYEEDA
ncbi:MAG: hypothetical protein QOJ11_1789 [Frankiales bacterium]|jgi:hypothetical protein|nr:hypothetical protein [Frankiales bacterium]